MMNPKTHDALFKWLITAFTEEFFEHYFPDVTIGAYAFIDKEFLSKVIKIKAEKSQDIIRQHSLLCKMLALKADDRETEPEALVYEIYRAAADMKATLTDEHLLLLDQWVNMYKKISKQRLESIKKETRMEFIAATITEHIFHEGLLKGKAEGKVEGKVEGEVEGQIAMLETLYHNKILSEEQFHAMVRPLRQKLGELMGLNSSCHIT